MTRPSPDRNRAAFVLAALALCGTAVCNAAEGTAARATIDPDLTARFSVTAPVSSLISEQARQFLRDFVAQGLPRPGADIAATRKAFDEGFAKPTLAGWRKLYPVDIQPEIIGGVQTDVVTPLGGAPSRTRILINLHGGGFVVGARYGGQLESVPMAGIGKVKVVTIDYRQGPEHKYPAASEDVAAVYKALLKHYKAANIGIYGCSAGGLLAAQSVAWFQTHGLPPPGAIGVFCAGALPYTEGEFDSRSIWPSLLVTGVDPRNDTLSALPRAPRLYLQTAAPDDPVAWPAISRDVLARFPPTLVISATRDPLMSTSIATHSRLVAAGADASLYVQEGLGHGFLAFMPGVPEAVDAYQAAWKFFDKQLGW